MVDTTRFETTFAMLDKDGDGRISAAEFKEIMATLGVTYTDETAAQAIALMDQDGDGLVTLEELATYMAGPGASGSSSPEPPASEPTDPPGDPAES
jgi:Ca2+-binding EF-hand superfamily protein